MAQRVGLDSVPVMVKAVHREWWQEVTAGTTGRAALQRVTEALTTCKPETAPGESWTRLQVRNPEMHPGSSLLVILQLAVGTLRPRVCLPSESP